MTELLIYTPQITPRTNYIFQLFFGSVISTAYTVTSDEAAFQAYSGPKLNYSGTIFPGHKLQIIPSGLLTEKGVKIHSIEVSVWNQYKIFYRTDRGSMPFDVFSASFYLVTRYEEYYSDHVDKHGRFKPKESLAYRNRFLDTPLINVWAEELKKIILTEYPSVLFTENKYTFIPTMDIDVAYAYLGRNIFVTIGSYLKSLYKLKLKTAIEKKLVWLRLKKDPYNTYRYQEAIYKKYNLHPIYFFLAAAKRGEYDKNISPRSRRFKKLVTRISSFARVGIHPSYQSESKLEIVTGELKSVERNLPGKITCSRQHFLKINFPVTYRGLAQLGITDDYSMAYAGAAGFRASICTPFFFYDLKAESVLPVKVHSSAVMDGTLNEYLKVNRGDAVVIIRELINITKKLNGEFIPIWHNHSISDYRRWKGWKKIFEYTIETGKD